MQERQIQLLEEIAREYVKTAEPVGSKLLADRYHKELSSATIRNDMAILEDEGLVHQPHTSAGRIPTEKGFRFLLEKIDKTRKPPEREKSLLEDGLHKHDVSEQMIKQLAKNIAHVAGNAVVVGFRPRVVYYTGLSMLFAQPEFAQQAAVCSLTEVVDQLDEVMEKVCGMMKEQVEVRLGSDNPFGLECGLVMTSWSPVSVFGIVGPLRMDYQANIARMNHVRILLNC